MLLWLLQYVKLYFIAVWLMFKERNDFTVLKVSKKEQKVQVCNGKDFFFHLQA